MFLRDLRYAWRSISKAPGLIAVAVTCLALGIGIDTAIFSVVDGVMLKPFPFRMPIGSLYNVTLTDPLSFAGVAVFLVCIAAAASYVPARRATAVDAIVAIRNE